MHANASIGNRRRVTTQISSRTPAATSIPKPHSDGPNRSSGENQYLHSIPVNGWLHDRVDPPQAERRGASTGQCYVQDKSNAGVCTDLAEHRSSNNCHGTNEISALQSPSLGRERFPAGTQNPRAKQRQGVGDITPFPSPTLWSACEETLTSYDDPAIHRRNPIESHLCQ